MKCFTTCVIIHHHLPEHPGKTLCVVYYTIFCGFFTALVFGEFPPEEFARLIEVMARRSKVSTRLFTARGDLLPTEKLSLNRLTCFCRLFYLG